MNNLYFSEAVKILTKDCKGELIDEFRKVSPTDEAFKVYRKQVLDSFEEMEKRIVGFMAGGKDNA